MKYKCPECNSLFSDQETLCQDWRDKRRSLGCPNCLSFFLKKTNKAFSRNRTSFAILSSGIATPALIMLLQYPKSQDIAFLLFGSVILFSSLALMVINAREQRNFPSELEKVEP